MRLIRRPCKGRRNCRMPNIELWKGCRICKQGPAELKTKNLRRAIKACNGCRNCGNCGGNCTASVHTLHMSKAVIAFVFKVLRKGVLRYILYTCPHLWLRSCSKCYGMDCFGTYSTHVQSIPKLWLHLCSKCYRMDCFGAHSTHVQTCDYVRVQTATEWTASVHTLHMSKAVITFVFKVLRNGLLRYMLYTCPNLWLRLCSKCYDMDFFGAYSTHVQSCDYVRVQSATEWTASVHTLHMSKAVIAFVFKMLCNGLLRYILYTFPKLWLRSCSTCCGMDCFGTYFTCSKLWLRSCSKCYGMGCFGTYFTHVQSCDYVRVKMLRNALFWVHRKEYNWEASVVVHEAANSAGSRSSSRALGRMHGQCYAISMCLALAHMSMLRDVHLSSPCTPGPC